MDGAKSAVSHGWLFARPACTIILKMPQAPEGLISRTRLFASFLVFSKMTAPGRGFPVSCATAHRSPERMLLAFIIHEDSASRVIIAKQVARSPEKRCLPRDEGDRVRCDAIMASGVE